MWRKMNNTDRIKKARNIIRSNLKGQKELIIGLNQVIKDLELAEKDFTNKLNIMEDTTIWLKLLRVLHLR